MRLLAIMVAADDAEYVADRCWSAGIAGLWEVGQPDGRVELRAGTDDPERLRRALPEYEPADITEQTAVTLATRTVDVSIGGVLRRFMVPPTVFGDGHHPTTAACVAHLSDCVRPGMPVLDIGCGSGVLSVAAALAGGRVRAIDLDDAAVSATLANAESNGVQVVAGTTALDAIDPSWAEVVVANISAATIRANATAITRVARPDAAVILSGVLDHQWPDVLGDFGGDAEVERTTSVDGWTTATLRLEG